MIIIVNVIFYCISLCELLQCFDHHELWLRNILRQYVTGVVVFSTLIGCSRQLSDFSPHRRRSTLNCRRFAVNAAPKLANRFDAYFFCPRSLKAAAFNLTAV